jgi:hypothetical protein
MREASRVREEVRRAIRDSIREGARGYRLAERHWRM